MRRQRLGRRAETAEVHDPLNPRRPRSLRKGARRFAILRLEIATRAERVDEVVRRVDPLERRRQRRRVETIALHDSRRFGDARREKRWASRETAHAMPRAHERPQ